MSAQEILKLIESVDVTDTAKLDKINEAVFVYVMNEEASEKDISEFPWTLEAYRIASERGDKSVSYCDSRDALKAIRPQDPKNFFITIEYDYDFVWYCHIEWLGKGDFTGESTTEELAELHAIIQAIEYNRNSQ